MVARILRRLATANVSLLNFLAFLLIRTWAKGLLWENQLNFKHGIHATPLTWIGDTHHIHTPSASVEKSSSLECVTQSQYQVCSRWQQHFHQFFSSSVNSVFQQQEGKVLLNVYWEFQGPLGCIAACSCMLLKQAGGLNENILQNRPHKSPKHIVQHSPFLSSSRSSSVCLRDRQTERQSVSLKDFGFSSRGLGNGRSSSVQFFLHQSPSFLPSPPHQ